MKIGLRANGIKRMVSCLMVLLLLFPSVASAAAKLPAWPSTPLYGVNFSAFTADPNNTSNLANVAVSKARLKKLVGQTKWVRFYGLDRNQADVVLAAKAMGFSVAVGAWISGDAANSQAQVDALIALIRRGKVDLAVVGNEALSGKTGATKADLLGYIAQVKAAANGRIPVTTAETPAIWLDNPELVRAVDTVGLNVYPFWAKTSINSALADFSATVSRVASVTGGKQVIVTETGWPSAGGSYGDAVCSAQNAQRYLDEVSRYTSEHGIPLFWFSAFDESWKTDYEQSFGAYWGLYNGSGAQKVLLYPALKPGAKGAAVQRMQKRLAELGYYSGMVNAIFDRDTLSALNTFSRAKGGKSVSGASTLLQLQLCAADAPAAQAALTEPQATQTPDIVEVRMPAYGKSGYLTGRVTGVPGSAYLVVYLQVEGNWWVKPYLDAFVTVPGKSGAFSVDVDTGGIDEYATAYEIYLLTERPTSSDRSSVAAKAVLKKTIAR